MKNISKEDLEGRLAARCEFFSLVQRMRFLQRKFYEEKRGTRSEKQELYAILDRVDSIIERGVTALKEAGLVEDDPDKRWNGGYGDLSYCQTAPRISYNARRGIEIPKRMDFFLKVMELRKWQIRISTTGQTSVCLTPLFGLCELVDRHIAKGELHDQLETLSEETVTYPDYSYKEEQQQTTEEYEE